MVQTHPTPEQVEDFYARPVDILSKDVAAIVKQVNALTYATSTYRDLHAIATVSQQVHILANLLATRSRLIYETASRIGFYGDRPGDPDPDDLQAV